ncbi:MAG: sugar phosphate isomerase/epimerase [Anaerolineaceae bacterium]|nr:sugar phosphate isomerase/epimerase [Anaerolineaceae bacterium]
MKLGVMTRLDEQVEARFQDAAEMGFPTTQLVCWDENFFTAEYARRAKAASEKTGVAISAFWCGYGGPSVWTLYEGQVTLGLVPPTYRYDRMQTLMRGADFAKMLGVEDIVTHCGFIPENPNDPNFAGVVAALKHIGKYCQSLGLHFLFETGQETPTTLLRTIEEIGLDNMGVNLDPANLILYGRGNPVDALDTFGQYIRGVHAKDGCYPTSGRYLGEETALGKGKVDLPRLLRRLKEVGYTGALTIEREISGPQQKADILTGKAFLESILKEIGAYEC